MSESQNGYREPISRAEWEEHRGVMFVVAKKVDDIHSKIPVFLEHTSHLSKLDYLKDIKESLLSAAIGRNQLDGKLAVKLFGFAGMVILGLTLILVFLLTGEKFGWIAQLNH